MKLAPVVVFTFNRLDHTKRTIEALKSNILANDTELFIFSDGPRNDEEYKKVKSVREYIKNIDGFKNIEIIESKKNKGLAKSVIEGVTEIINKYGKVIVLEDDLVTSKFFLKYMNYGLNLYEERNDIWSISGYGPNINIPSNYNEDVYMARRGSSWGWATWKNRWDLVDWDITEYKEFIKNKKEVNKFNEFGKDLSPMLEDQIKGRIDSWAIRWVFNQYKKDMWTIYPIKSLVRNIGNDLSGTHTTITTNFEVDLTKSMPTLKYSIEENKEINNNFKIFYDKNFSGYLALFIKKIGLYKYARKVRNKIIKLK